MKQVIKGKTAFSWISSLEHMLLVSRHHFVMMPQQYKEAMCLSFHHSPS